MIWMWLLLSCLLVWLPPAPGQDVYHTKSKTWFSQETELPNAYFGYSITYVPTSKRLIVSAPQGDDIGHIYSCEIESQTCTSVPTNVTRKNPEYTHNFWLGAVVKGGNSFFVTCAPLFTELHGYKPLNSNSTERYEVGIFSRCYKYSNPAELPSQLDSLSKNETNMYTTVFEQTMGTFGWSIDVTEDNIIIGGPAMFTGRAIKYSGNNASPRGLSGINGPTLMVDYDFGYSVAAGYFRKSGNNFRTYAVSSPYGKNGFGKILFYGDDVKGLLTYSAELSPTDSESEMELKRVPVGSMFGAALCAARLTPQYEGAARPKGRVTRPMVSLVRPTALVVGAPTFAMDHHYNQGAVFIYLPGKNFATEFLRRIVGEKDDSYFGSAIVNLGDMNGDGMDEIAIGAPYEDSGAGAVYVYSSYDIVSDKPVIKWMQRIVAEPATAHRSFGLSLTALQDYDENGCNELAIGAPESNKVMLLRCIATITVKLQEKIHTVKNKANRNDTHFQFESCLDVTYPEKPVDIEARIKVQLQISHPDARLVNSADKEHVIILNNKEEKTKCRRIVIETPVHGDFGIPIKYMITGELLHPPSEMQKFEVKRVGLSDLSVLTSSDSIWIAECDNPNNCMPDLKYLGIEVFEKVPYMIGSTKALAFDMSFRNGGETAYNPCVVVVLSGASVAQAPPDCARDSGTKLHCAPKQRLKTNNTWNTKAISLDTTRLTNEFGFITVHVYMYNECTDKKQTKPFEENIFLEADPKGIFVKGITDSGPDNMVNMTKADIALGKAFEQSYTISNNGQFDWGGLTVKIILQKRYFIQIASIILSTAGSPTGPQECEVFTESDDEISYTCKLNQLQRNRPSKLILYMIVEREVMDTVIEKEENSVYTSFFIYYKDDELKKMNLTTTFHLKDAVVPFWVILAASLIGLILLLIIFLILRECGFFRREKKENLEQVQRHVKRQTIIRKSMAQGVRLPPVTDSEHLISTEDLAHVTSTKTTDNRIRVPST